jgi:hypothetical protein
MSPTAAPNAPLSLAPRVDLQAFDPGCRLSVFGGF